MALTGHAGREMLMSEWTATVEEQWAAHQVSVLLSPLLLLLGCRPRAKSPFRYG